MRPLKRLKMPPKRYCNVNFYSFYSFANCVDGVIEVVEASLHRGVQRFLAGRLPRVHSHGVLQGR